MKTNERKIESVVREHFKKYEDQIILEEQISDNELINSLLKSASKNKNNKHGFPEFIIRIKKKPNLLLVIECKPEIRFHISDTLQNTKQYAVDGAIWYGEKLKKEFDVISIGVSGDSLQNLLVSHNLHLKNNETYDLSISKLLSIDSYIELYDKDERKVRQDYDSLISYSDKLNKRLFELKIPEPDRALLLSAVLIALNNKRFIDSFKECELSSELCSLLVNVVETEMKKNNLDNYSIETVIKSFNFICNNPFFTKDITVLSDLIREIDTNVNQFVQTKKYYDILGQFYVKFLEKCNSDKKLGIVLTPNHITEFMGDLVHLSSESVLYENCTGTGGFVISGIKKMIDSSSGEFEVKEKIKNQNFIGVEYQPQIYSLLVCNMMLNGLSPSNVIRGNSFDPEIIEKVKQKKPNCATINPPYDGNELEFIENALDCIQINGKVAAIVPMSTAISTNKTDVLLRERILSKHTLEAVVSMPNELFHNSKAGVVTCIMVLTSKIPHSNNKETFFAIFKEDGFEKRKHLGRIDVKNKWGQIKNDFLEMYENRKIVPNVSTMKKVRHNDEWCAEYFLETDYSELTEKDFELTLKSFILANQLK